MMKAVISHPFSGALYAFFATHNECRRRPAQPKEPHPYYRTLYGDGFPRYQEMALTLLLLFDQVIIVPADAYLPRGFWQEDRTYDNPSLGLYTEWDFAVQRELDEQIVLDLEDEEIRRVLRRVPPLSRQQILRDSRHEILLAQKYNCPILCVGGRRHIIERILQRQPLGPAPYNPTGLRMAEEYLRMVGPVFEPKDLETLVALRQDPELRSYAGAFASVMEAFRESNDVRADLLKAMQRAMSSARVAKSMTGVFDGTATVLNVIGLVPLLGTAASAVGLAAEGASTVLERRERSQSWFEFAGQIKRVTSIVRLEKEIAKAIMG